MHLLATQAGSVQDGSEPVNTGQSPADVVVISAADTEIAALSEARAALGAEAPSLRLLNLVHLQHPMSVDMHLDACATRSRLVVARVLGGAGYWRYGLEQYAIRLCEAGVPFAALPGDDRPDADLLRLSSVGAEDWQALLSYLVEGGPENAGNFLRYARWMIDRPPAALTPEQGADGSAGRQDAGTDPSAPPGSGRETGGGGVAGAGVAQSARDRAGAAAGADGGPGGGGDAVAPLSPQAAGGSPSLTPSLAPPAGPGGGGEAGAPLSPQAAGGSPSLPPSLAPPAGRRGRAGGAERPGAARPLLRAGLYWPGSGQATPEAVRAGWTDGAAVVPLVFYRALLEGAGLDPVNRLVRALMRRGLNPLPVFVASLKDPVSAATLTGLLREAPPAVILNCTAFAVGTPEGTGGADPLAAFGVPVFQVVLSGGTEAAWEEGQAGLSPRDIAMNVALPEVDGRILTRAVSFKDEAYFDEATECPVTAYQSRGDRIDFVADLSLNWVRLARTAPKARKVALVLANYPNRDGRLANGVGLDTPASAVAVLRLLEGAGYHIRDLPADGAALMQAILAGPTNWLADRVARQGGKRLPLADYRAFYATLSHGVRMQVEERWGEPEADPFFTGGAFVLAVLEFGNACIGVQPARGYNIDPKATYHAPDLVPPHHYLAYYAWARGPWRAQAIVHLGKHGNLEWLPGKALALSADCLPEAVLGPMPHLYPFIVNDPGEGAQAKRRAQAVIVDHLTPPLTRAESYGPLRELEALLDEFYEAAGLDARRAGVLRRDILALSETTGIAADAGLDGADPAAALTRLDAWLCDLKEAQIRDGLHVFGASPAGRQERDLVQALVRLPRGTGAGAASLPRALAADLGLSRGDPPFDPLACDMAAPWTGPRPGVLAGLSPDPWRTAGDVVERLELLASALLDGVEPGDWPATRAVLYEVAARIRPAVAACGGAEGAALLAGLGGGFIAPGPSGAPTRGRPEVLPTGRNFYSVDTRALPTPTAWSLGWASATALLDRHVMEEGEWPRALLITAWGTACMRTGGDDIAQALALMGVRPVWDTTSRRVTGFEILPLSVLGRPRVDVTLRVSGFFRDAFPGLIDLMDSAARAVMALEEPGADNPAAARFRAEGGDLRAGFRVFGSKPGAYGAGLQALIDERIWTDRADLAASWLDWGGHAYGAGAEGLRARDLLATRVAQVDAVVQNQDNREHDLLDSDDYYQFEGGAAAAVASLQGQDRPVWHMDHSRPERPVARTLDEEIARVVRSRAVNPKWIEGVKRHGYKGAFEIAATVDYLFAFAATTRAVRGHHFDLVEAAFLGDEATRAFIADANPAALREIADRLAEAIDRGLWQPRSNSAAARIAAARGGDDARNRFPDRPEMQ